LAAPPTKVDPNQPPSPPGSKTNRLAVTGFDARVPATASGLAIATGLALLLGLNRWNRRLGLPGDTQQPSRRTN